MVQTEAGCDRDFSEQGNYSEKFAKAKRGADDIQWMTWENK